MDPSLYRVFFEVEDRHWWFVGRRFIVDAFLSRALGSPAGPGSPPPDRRILDVGCGTGGMLPLLSRYGRVTGVDPEPLALEYCRKRGIGDVHLQQDFDGGPEFDLVTLFDVLEHVEDEPGFLARMGSFLKPGGRLVVTVPAFQFLWSRHDDLNFHQRRYTRKRLLDGLTGAGFAVRRCSYFNTLLFPAAALVRLLDGRGRGGSDGAETEVLRHLRIGSLNRLLGALFKSERFWLRGFDLPFGVSLYAEAGYPDRASST